MALRRLGPQLPRSLRAASREVTGSPAERGSSMKSARERPRGRIFAGAFLTGLDQPLAMVLTRIGLSTTNAMTAAMMLRIAAT